MARGDPDRHDSFEWPAPHESLLLAEAPAAPTPASPKAVSAKTPSPKTPSRRGDSAHLAAPPAERAVLPAAAAPSRQFSNRVSPAARRRKKPALPHPGTPPAVETAKVARAPKQARPSAGTIPPAATIGDETRLGPLVELLQNAPAWLISAVVHTSLLIVLGMCLVAVKHRGSLEQPGIDIAAASVEAGDALESSQASGTAPQAARPADSPILAPDPLAAGHSPFGVPPLPTNVPLGSGHGTDELHVPTVGLAVAGREGGLKKVLLGVYGGNGETEGAVELGLAWLAKQQESDGSWTLTGKRGVGGMNSPTAATAMALLAFQGAGNTPHRGRYSHEVSRGWQALLAMQQRDGRFGKPAGGNQVLYAHAQATIALCEILGMTKDSRFFEPAKQAVDFCLASQDKRQGGWRYSFKPATDSDTSVTGWFVMALKSAQMAGIDVPPTVFYDVTRYLDSVDLKDGTYGYLLNSHATLGVTAEAYLCRQLLGWQHDDRRLIEGCHLLLANPVQFGNGDQPNVYYWYYATQVCHHMEGAIWYQWNEAMRRELPAHQETEGPDAGSWDPKRDSYGRTAGRLYTTCLSIYCLEVYYRHLPLYSAAKFGKQ